MTDDKGRRLAGWSLDGEAGELVLYFAGRPPAEAKDVEDDAKEWTKSMYRKLGSGREQA